MEGTSTDYAQLFLQVSIALSALGTVLGSTIAFLQQWRENKRAPVRDKGEEKLQDAQYTSQLQMVAIQMVEQFRLDVQQLRNRCDSVESEMLAMADIIKTFDKAIIEGCLIVGEVLKRSENISEPEPCLTFMQLLELKLSELHTILETAHQTRVDSEGTRDGTNWNN